MSPVNLRVSVASQRLLVLEADGGILREYVISTARNGVGTAKGSYCTPTGLHIVRAKIGAGLASGTVIVGRRPTGEIFTPELATKNPTRDWILSRILWLSGLEPGVNRLGKVDTMQRYIYIHGTADEQLLGTPVSHGCIRMASRDVIELFDLVPIGTRVEISETE